MQEVFEFYNLSDTIFSKKNIFGHLFKKKSTKKGLFTLLDKEGKRIIIFASPLIRL